MIAAVQEKMTKAWTRELEVVRVVDFWICKDDCNVSGLDNWKDGVLITCDEKAVAAAGLEEFSIGHTSLRYPLDMWT